MPKDTRRESDIAKLFGQVPALAQEVAEHVAQGPITPFLTPGQIRRQLATGFDLSSPMPLEDVLREVVSMLDEGMVQVTHPRYFGLFNPSVTPASVVADALVAAYNPQLAAWSHAPVANEMERLTLDRLMEHLGFHPATSAANFTAGGAEANLTALLVALAHRFPLFPASASPHQRSMQLARWRRRRPGRRRCARPSRPGWRPPARNGPRTQNCSPMG